MNIVQQLREAYAADKSTESSPVFGSTLSALPKRKYITTRSYATTPWMKGTPPPMPTACSVGEKLHAHLRTMPADELERYNISGLLANS
jgi:hypothetical protein